MTSWDVRRGVAVRVVTPLLARAGRRNENTVHGEGVSREKGKKGRNEGTNEIEMRFSRRGQKEWLTWTYIPG